MDGVKFQKEVEVGRWIDTGELMEEMLRDRLFMEESGGGLSFSGGEPLLQPEALFRLLELSGEQDIHTCVDTSGYGTAGNMEKVSMMADMILYDLKTMDDEKHIKYTGVSNRKIIENLERVLQGSAEVVVRIPVVQGFNVTKGEIGALLDYLGMLDKLEAVDILPYHPFGTNKYRRFNRENRQNGFSTPGNDRIEEIRNRFQDAGFKVRVGG